MVLLSEWSPLLHPDLSGPNNATSRLQPAVMSAKRECRLLAAGDYECEARMQAVPVASKRFSPPDGLVPDAHKRLPRNVRGAGGCQGAGCPSLFQNLTCAAQYDTSCLVPDARLSATYRIRLRGP